MKPGSVKRFLANVRIPKTWNNQQVFFYIFFITVNIYIYLYLFGCMLKWVKVLGKNQTLMNEVDEWPGKNCSWDVFLLVLKSRGVVIVASVC